MPYILENPFCTFAEIWRYFKPRFNWEDLRHDFFELAKADCIRLFFNNVCLTKPLPQRYLLREMYYEKWDYIVSIIRENPHLVNNEFFIEFLRHNKWDHLSQFKKSKMKKSLMKYHEKIDPKRKLNEQLFSKFFKVLQVQEKILNLGLRKMSWTRQTFFENHAKIDTHLRKMILVLDSFQSFLKDYDRTDSELNDLYPGLGKYLDGLYKSYKGYLDAHKSGKKPVEYRKKILQETRKYSKGYVARKHGVTRKQIRNIIKPIISHKGNLRPSQVVLFTNAETSSDLLN